LLLIWLVEEEERRIKLEGEKRTKLGGERRINLGGEKVRVGGEKGE